MKFIKLLTASLVALSLHAADKDHTIIVGVSPVPHAEILEFVKPKLKDKGYDLVISEISDYSIPNVATEDGSLDANFFQHLPYLEEQNKARGLHLVSVASVHVEPLGFYSKKIKNIKDLKSLLEGPQYTRWRTFRENEDAKYTGCMVNRFLTRSPYIPEDTPKKSFNSRESVDKHDDMLWGNGAYAFATRLTESFADYRWCGNIIGPKGGGAVKDLPTYTYENYGSVQTKIPTEVLITDRREFELAENGFITLTLRRDSNNAAFFSANSVLKPKVFPNTPEGKAAETNFRLGTQLPYVFLISRLAHYLKVLQREEIGTWKERSDVERGLNEWLRQYISDQENPPADVRSRRPFRSAKVIVSDIAGEPGWYKIELLARPHFKFMGANFELSLVGKLDKE